MWFILVGVIILAFYSFYWKRRGLPPGPTPLPILGNVLALKRGTKAPYDVSSKWHKQYGPVITYWIGEKPIISVTNFDLIKETFIKDGETYSGRDFFPKWNEIVRGEMAGVFVTDGEMWREQRRFALMVLRNFGMGRNLIEDMVMQEVERLIGYFDEKIAEGCRLINSTDIVDISVGSIINQMLFGYRFIDKTESEFYTLKRLMSNQLQSTGDPLAQILMREPKFWRNIPIFRTIYKRMVHNTTSLMAFFDEQIAEHRKVYSIEGDPEKATNYVQAFLMESNKREKKGEENTFTNNQLRSMCFDMWIAGQETTSNTTNFGILYLLNNPAIQSKMQAELDKVIGNERRVTLADRPNLPYVNAVINETQRLCNLLPQNLPHRTLKDVVINGVEIKKNSTIIAQISTLLYDEKVRPIDASNPPTTEPINGITVSPQPYNVELRRRIPKIE